MGSARAGVEWQQRVERPRSRARAGRSGIGAEETVLAQTALTVFHGRTDLQRGYEMSDFIH